MTEGWFPIVAELHVDESPAEKAARAARQQAERTDRQAERDEADRQAAAEDERDARLFRYAQMGMSGRTLGEITADVSRAADEDAEYEAARAVMAKIDRRRESRARAVRFQAEQMAEVSRLHEPADPLEAAAMRAHRAFAEHTRAKLSEAVTGTPRERRPFASRSRGAGEVVRSEMCQHCIDQGVDDETSYLLHSDPELAVPVTPPVQVQQAEYRSEAGVRTPMIYR